MKIEIMMSGRYWKIENMHIIRLWSWDSSVLILVPRD